MIAASYSLGSALLRVRRGLVLVGARVALVVAVLLLLPAGLGLLLRGVLAQTIALDGGVVEGEVVSLVGRWQGSHRGGLLLVGARDLGNAGLDGALQHVSRGICLGLLPGQHGLANHAVQRLVDNAEVAHGLHHVGAVSAWCAASSRCLFAIVCDDGSQHAAQAIVLGVALAVVAVIATVLPANTAANGSHGQVSLQDGRGNGFCEF